MLAKREGFVVVKIIKEEYDHHVYVVDQHGKRRILKTITKPELWPNLARDIAYSALIATVTSADTNWTVRSSAPLASGDGWLLRELLDAGPLVDVDDLNHPRKLDRLGAALANLDTLSPDPASRRPAYRDQAGEPVADDGYRLAELERWVRDLQASAALAELDAESLLRRLVDDRPRIQPGFEMWDVKLEDFLELPDGKVGIYDLEFAYLYGRRHYDAARLFATLTVLLGAPGPAVALLRAYLSASRLPLKAIGPACLPVLTETLLAELYDATLTQATDRQHSAREQLKKCLTGGLDALLGGR